MSCYLFSPRRWEWVIIRLTVSSDLFSEFISMIDLLGCLFLSLSCYLLLMSLLTVQRAPRFHLQSLSYTSPCFTFFQAVVTHIWSVSAHELAPLFVLFLFQLERELREEESCLPSSACLQPCVPKAQTAPEHTGHPQHSLNKGLKREWLMLKQFRCVEVYCLVCLRLWLFPVSSSLRTGAVPSHLHIFKEEKRIRPYLLVP